MLTSSAIRPTSRRHTNAHKRQGVPSLSRFNPWSQTKEGAALTDKHRPTCPPEDTGLPGDECVPRSLLWLSWEVIEGLIPMSTQQTPVDFGLLPLSFYLSLHLSFTFSEHLSVSICFVFFRSRLHEDLGTERRGRGRKGGVPANTSQVYFSPLILLMTRDKESMCDLHVQSHDGYSDQITLRELTKKSQSFTKLGAQQNIPKR